MLDETGESQERLIDAIAAYLARSPAAADTARGIADWWMSAMGLDVSADEVARALDELVRRGVVECTPVPGCDPVYRAAARRH